MDQEKYERLKEMAREAKSRSFQRKVARDKERQESSLFWAVKRVKEEARSDTWCTNHGNCFRYSQEPAESDAHVRMKFERFLHWRKFGATVFTEVRWKEAGRSDLVICLNNGEIFIEEIVSSEKEESLLLKAEKYPFPIKIIKCPGDLNVSRN